MRFVTFRLESRYIVRTPFNSLFYILYFVFRLFQLNSRDGERPSGSVDNFIDDTHRRSFFPFFGLCPKLYFVFSSWSRRTFKFIICFYILKCNASAADPTFETFK